MAYLSFLIIPVILLLPIVARVEIYFDLSRKMLAVNVAVWKITLFKIIYRVIDGQLMFSINNGNYQFVQKKDDNNFEFGKIMLFLDGIKIKNVKVQFRTGADDAAAAALLSAAVDCVLQVVAKSKISVTNCTDYTDNTTVGARATLFTMPILLLISLIKFTIKEKKYVGD